MNTLRITRPVLLLTAGIVCLVVGLALFGANATLAQTNPSFHPAIALLDASGAPVQTSGAPVSTLTTCGNCHDTTFIAANSSHADGALRSVRQDAAPFVAESTAQVETNCFLCHLAQPDNAARLAALDSGQPQWASSATLRAVGLITQSASGWRWNTGAFRPDGMIDPALLGLQDPTDANCGQCHGTVHSDGQTPLTLTAGESGWETLLRGQVFSPQRISSSGLNIENKDTLTRVWDVHAERVVGCTDCHYALNNPVFDTQPNITGPDHLQFDPRRMDFGEYLRRPLHQFANSSGAAQSGFGGAARSCASCHDAVNTHTWLPYTERHFSAMTCETCHVPTLYAPALESVDWTVLSADGSPRMTYRGLDDALIAGFQPVVLPTVGTDGATRLSPYNVVSRWYWVAADGTPVSEADLRAAWLLDGAYAPEILAAFDADASGALEESELLLNTPEQVGLIAARLSALGVSQPRIVGDVRAYAIHHNVIGGQWAQGDCTACHADQSRLAALVTLGSGTRGGGTLMLAGDLPLNGTLQSGADGQVFYRPALVAAPPQTPLVDLYVLGHHSVEWINWIGALAFLGVAFGISAHAGLRVLALRRQTKRASKGTKRTVYLYGVYERVWHWLQTFMIAGLLFTGLVIHNPETFGMFSFQGVVLVHNLLALILVINAAFALVYHLVSGEIRQYLPKPYGFFDNAVMQAKYYLHGIFRGHPHPFAKTPDQRLNPLQQITYLAILNILLPLQIITGALMWAAPRLPDLTAQLGGLGFLAPFHTLIAWAFATFMVLHVYLTTTGHTPTASIKAMMLGWEETEETASQVSSSGPAPAQEVN
ncbi:MAG: cytochrome b/b6 domain-containing protein [Chloroflexi bacterium]|nr:cytochrome b/b6 domain-containing protein [Chloroflexota bacterium]